MIIETEFAILYVLKVNVLSRIFNFTLLSAVHSNLTNSNVPAADIFANEVREGVRRLSQ